MRLKPIIWLAWISILFSVALCAGCEHIHYSRSPDGSELFEGDGFLTKITGKVVAKPDGTREVDYSKVGEAADLGTLVGSAIKAAK